MNDRTLRKMAIESRVIDATEPPYLIAEAGVNHDGDLDLAFALIEGAAECGADAVKFQTFKAEELVASDTPRAEYQARNTRSDEPQLAMLRELALPDAAFEKLATRCNQTGIAFLSSPHTESAVDVLRDLVPAFKIGSGDLTNRLLLERVAETKKGVLIGTGMSTLDEVSRALEWLELAGADWVIPLQCTTSYPCADADVHLRAMITMQSALELPVGYSDHTPDGQVAVMAAGLGAVVIEKHFTLDRTRPGPDHAASIEPPELSALAASLKRVPMIMGHPAKKPTPCELEIRPTVRKGLVAARNLPVGTVLSREHLRAQRPVGEIDAAELARVLGRTLERAVEGGEALSWQVLAPVDE